MKVAQLIQSQVVDNNTQAEQLKEIFNRYITALRNKEQYKTRSFSVGLTIKQRTFLSNNPDVQIEFVMDADYESAEQLALQNSNVNRMVYYVGPQYRDNKRLYNAFYWYCQANRYMATPVTSEDNKRHVTSLKNVQTNFTMDSSRRSLRRFSIPVLSSPDSA